MSCDSIHRMHLFRLLTRIDVQFRTSGYHRRTLDIEMIEISTSTTDWKLYSLSDA